MVRYFSLLLPIFMLGCGGSGDYHINGDVASFQGLSDILNRTLNITHPTNTDLEVETQMFTMKGDYGYQSGVFFAIHKKGDYGFGSYGCGQFLNMEYGATPMYFQINDFADTLNYEHMKRFGVPKKIAVTTQDDGPLFLHGF